MLDLMYITNDIDVALIAEKCGVEYIFIDLEYLGKEERQKNLDTVKSKHSEDDVKFIAQQIKKSKILVRVNPINEDSAREIDTVIRNGADYVMLPMFKTSDEVRNFLDYVDGRAKTILLLEHITAVEIIDEILCLPGIDRVHIGLNDLHLSMKLDFMFELFTNGMVDFIVKKINSHNIPYGIGGIGKIGCGDVPAETIIAEHYRVGSTAAILSRSFCNTDKVKELPIIENIFEKGIKEIRDYEQKLESETISFFENNHKKMKELINRRGL